MILPWPTDSDTLWTLLTRAAEGTLGCARLQGHLWTLDADDRKWHRKTVTFPELLWSKTLHSHLGAQSALAMAQIHELLMEGQAKGGSHLRRKTGSYYTQRAVARAC